MSFHQKVEDDEDQNSFFKTAQLSKCFLQNRLTQQNFNLKNATLLSASISPYMSVQKKQDIENTYQINQIEKAFSIPSRLNKITDANRSTSTQKYHQEIKLDNLKTQNYFTRDKYITVSSDKYGKFGQTFDITGSTFHRDSQTTNTNTIYLRSKQESFTSQINQKQHISADLINNQDLESLNQKNKRKESDSKSQLLFNKTSKYSGDFDFILQNDEKEQKSKSNFLKDREGEQFNQTNTNLIDQTKQMKKKFSFQIPYENKQFTPQINKHKLSSSIHSQINTEYDIKGENQLNKPQNEKNIHETQLSRYLSHLSRDFQNDSSLNRLFKANNSKFQKDSLNSFYDHIQNEFSDNKKEKSGIPKLQQYVKKIQNYNMIKHSMDKRYLKQRQENNKKKQLQKDAKNIDPSFMNYDSILQNLCNNMQQFIQLNRNKTVSSARIQQIHGFNDQIRTIVFDELTGELRNDFNPAHINFVIGYLVNVENKNKGSQIPQFNQQSSTILGQPRRKGVNQTIEIKQDFLKKLYYFNKTLEGFNNEKISQNRNNEVMIAKKDASLVEQKLNTLMLQNRVNYVDSKGIFQELKKGILYSNGSPLYGAQPSLSHALNVCELSNGKFDHILHRNRYQSQCLDKICEEFKQL